MKNTLLTCLTLAALMLSGCVVGLGTTPVAYTRHYASPSLVVIPGTYVYVVPDIGADIYFHVGYWWRLSDGLWYRSHHYDRGWNRYRGIPVFYHQIDPGWRTYYAKRQWHGHPWKYERIPAHRVQQEWSRWETTRHWEKGNNWGVQGWKAAGHRRQIDAASPPARTALRQPDRHQDYRTDRVRGENVDARQPRLQNDRTRGDHAVRQSRNAEHQRDVVATGTHEGDRLGNRPVRRQQDFMQRQAKDDVTRRGPANSQTQNDRRWQAPSQRQEREGVTRQNTENSQPQDGRRWQAPSQRQEREGVTRQNTENSQPQDGRRWQAPSQRQEREGVTRQSRENLQPQEGRNWQASSERQGRVVSEETRPSPDQYRQRAHEGDRQPPVERRHRQDNEDSSNVLRQPGSDVEIVQDPMSHNP